MSFTLGFVKKVFGSRGNELFPMLLEAWTSFVLDSIHNFEQVIKHVQLPLFQSQSIKTCYIRTVSFQGYTTTSIYNSARVDYSLYILREHVQDKIEVRYYNLGKICFSKRSDPILHPISFSYTTNRFFLGIKVKIAKKFSREFKQKSVHCKQFIVL